MSPCAGVRMRQVRCESGSTSSSCGRSSRQRTWERTRCRCVRSDPCAGGGSGRWWRLSRTSTTSQIRPTIAENRAMAIAFGPVLSTLAQTRARLSRQPLNAREAGESAHRGTPNLVQPVAAIKRPPRRQTDNRREALTSGNGETPSGRSFAPAYCRHAVSG